jgi:cytochrome P450
VALRDTTLDGIAIPTGGIVIVSHLATNRDPNVFQHPDECLLDRPAKRHFAFGSGVHHCLGSHIGRMAANHFAQAFLPLAGKLALVPASPPHFVCTLDFNGAVSMPLRWKKQHQPTG